MSFSYGPNNVPPTSSPADQVRMLIADTTQFKPDGVTKAYVFSDEEIAQAFTLQATLVPIGIIGNGFRQSAAFPPPPISPLRVAALLMDSLASNLTRLQSVVKILDVTLSPRSAKDMQAQAKAWRDLDDNSGAFLIVEQTTTDFAFRDRWFNQARRTGV